MESRIAGAQSQPTERQSAISTDETAALATSPSVSFFALKPTPLKPTLFKMTFHLKIQDSKS